jgi:hypothetical protein
MSAQSELLDLLLSPEIVAAIDERVREIVRDELARQPLRRWVPLTDAAKQRGVTPAALRARVRRGTVEARREGRLLYVRLADGDRDGVTVR